MSAVRLAGVSTRFLIPLWFLAMAGAANGGSPPDPGQTETQAEARRGSPPVAAQITVPASQAPATLRLFVGRSLVVNSDAPLVRVSVTDPATASATIVSPNQVLIHGHLPGSVSLILWDEAGRTRSFDVQVELDLNLLRASLRQVLPQETVEVSQAGRAVVVSGRVSSKAAAERVVAMAQTHSEQVVNLLVEGSDQVLLKVRFAEVNRAAIQQLGINIFGTGVTAGNANVIGNVSTEQFASALGNIGAVPPDVQRGRDPNAPNLVAGGFGNPLEGTPAVFGLSDLLNIFIFLPDRNLGAILRALEQRNLLQILAEPNLLAQNGSEASFLAGGEFPFPTVQGVSGGLPAVTIQFREFGVRLKFTPTIVGDGRINLKVVHEVSSLDFSNALTISGFVVPALSTRRADTELQLGEGQSFAIAGLIDNRTTQVVSKIPWLGDIPILGKLFKSRSLERINTELLVMVTPQLVRPLEPGESPLLPGFPSPFLEKEKFDEKEKSDAKKGEKPPEGKPKSP